LEFWEEKIARGRRKSEQHGEEVLETIGLFFKPDWISSGIAE